MLGIQRKTSSSDQKRSSRSPLKRVRFGLSIALDGLRGCKAQLGVDSVAVRPKSCSQTPPLERRQIGASNGFDGLADKIGQLEFKPNECDKQDIPRKLRQLHETQMNSTKENGSLNSADSFQFTQITSRIAALTFTTNVPDHVYKSKLREISDGLKRNFPDQYKIFNVSQKRSDLGRSNSGVVVELGWPDNLSPPLDRLCSICKQIENWLASNSNNIAIIHCKDGWLERLLLLRHICITLTFATLGLKQLQTSFQCNCSVRSTSTVIMANHHTKDI